MTGMKHLKISVIQKNGRCPHNVGDTWEIPYALMKPKDLCDDAHYALIPYLSMAAGGGTSWERHGKWQIHCPSKTGIILEIERLDKTHKWPEDHSWVEKRKDG